MKFRHAMTAVGVAAALMDMGQFAGPRNPTKSPPRPVEQIDRTHRPIVVVRANDLWVKTFFTPSGAEDERPIAGILLMLKDAKETVYVQAYGFTSAKIADALIDAKQRGVDVRIILDRSEITDHHTRAWACQGAGIPVLFDSAHAISHNKIIIIDGLSVFTGSYNFTDSAEKHNAENCVLIVNEKIADQFTENWRDHEKHAKAWMPNPP